MKFRMDRESHTPSFFIERPFRDDALEQQHDSFLEILCNPSFDYVDKIKRICLHEKDTSDSHIMLIAEQFGKIKQPKRHKSRNKFFFVLRGKMKVSIFSEDMLVLNSVELEGCTEKSYFFVPENVIHLNLAITNEVIYFELMRGPFVRDLAHTEFMANTQERE